MQTLDHNLRDPIPASSGKSQAWPFVETFQGGSKCFGRLSFAHVDSTARTTISCSSGVTDHNRMLVLYKEMQCFATHNNYGTVWHVCSLDSLGVLHYYKSD